MNFALDKRAQQQQQTFSINPSLFAQTTSPTSMPISQMHLPPQQQPLRSFPNQFQANYQLSSNNSLNLLSPTGGSNTKPDTSSKQIQLSAQEINDFLSS